MLSAYFSVSRRFCSAVQVVLAPAFVLMVAQGWEVLERRELAGRILAKRGNENSSVDSKSGAPITCPMLTRLVPIPSGYEVM